MSKKFLCAATAAAILTSGCASGGFDGQVMNGIMSSWVGSSLNDAIRQWGLPHRSMVVGEETGYTWERNVELSLPSTATTSATVNTIGKSSYITATTTSYGGGNSSWACYRTLITNKAGVVVSYQWEGNNCPFMEAGPYANWRKK